MWLWLACTGPVEEDSCGHQDDKISWVVTKMDFARRDDAGQGLGFDIDGHTTSSGDSDGCGIADITSPDGTEGVDSAFSGILPTLEATQAVAVSGLIEDSIKSGELLIVPELMRVDDLADDDCVDFGLWRGEGVPMVGTDGELLDAQTFTRSELDPGLVDSVELVDGALVAAPFEYTLPVQILDVFVTFHMNETHLQMEVDEDGTMHGYFGGAVPLTDFDVITDLDDIGEVGDLLEGLLPYAADMDLDADGTCDAMTIVFEVEGTESFFYE
ncbi:MAG: hypothetical protein GY913_26600 [Proteobacteria bacterium]|nr:hypothetical protein [Pseudomonadota bacterium]